MIRNIKICIFLLFVSGLNAQVKDSVQVKIAIDTISVIQSIDSSYAATEGYLESEVRLDSLKSDTLIKPKMLYIERALLDSLLSPYYNIQIDSTKNNIYGRDIIITPRYRMVVENEGNDTSYVPLPSRIAYFSKKKTYGIDC